MKNIFFLLMLALMCALPAAGQAHKANGSRSKAAVPTVPPYCSPCLFYSGDFDPNNEKDYDLGNGKMLFNNIGEGAIYVPFVVPEGRTWTIRGLFMNELATVDVLDPATTPWSISSGVATGNAGTVVASGAGSATLSPTGRSWQGMAEYTIAVNVREFQLQSGTYWLSLLPQCTNKDNPSCTQAGYFATDVEDRPPQNFKGNSPADDSFVVYKNAGWNFYPTWGGPFDGACNVGCDRFSAGAIGVATRTGE